MVKPPQINLQHLITFFFVARENSFTVAADKLCLTQPAVTLQMRTLEQQFGVKLFFVKRKRVYLTVAGTDLFSHAEAIFHKATAAEAVLKSYKLGRLRLGVACTLTLYLRPLINRFQELNPSVQIILREAPSSRIIEELGNFQHDIVVVGPSAGPRKDLWVARVLNLEEMVLVSSPEYPLSWKGEAQWEDIVYYPLILQREGSAARQAVLDHFRSRGLTPLIGMEVDNIEMARALTIQSKGLAFMFLPNVKEELESGRLKVIHITDGTIKLGLQIAYNAGCIIPPPARSLLSILLAHFGVNGDIDNCMDAQTS